MNRFRQIGYWYWLALDILLAVGLFGIAPQALLVAIGLGAFQSFHYLIRQGRLSAFPVQVRIAYLGLLAIGQLGGVFLIVNWIQLIGTTALLLFDYCPLARIVSLMPWNRTRPFTWRLMWRTFCSRPVSGSFLDARPAER
ncbi:hypothetical protein SVA_3650 [Sulfurifustis variabilis]|uniref:Uncharacterized protein n=1 Tax=Sulfurifustis variabilis TaxID=1675686 RepID=A0A1C7AFP1_9GAMM|nr:hypothetical protein [Sulfurifustis variabilis]BAU50186.1 hypothetical protein SVA_3650 [Sulfurifustis variabilis]